jgi:general secretion pathway protein B
MSYILEALKKAQAERQLGNAPTIHAPLVHSVPAAATGRKPLVIGFAAGAVLVVGALVLWRQQPAAPVPQTVAPLPSSAPAHKPSAAPVPVPAHAAVAQPAARPHPADHASGPAPVAKAASPMPSPAPAVAGAAPLQTAAPEAPARAAPAAVAAVAAVDPAPRATAPASPSAEDTLHTLNELPEAIRVAVPKVAFGGYMYSPNPADRLVLVDKTLRREGEEVAPGLVLEKLLPRGALMNYRGYRYRVPF